MYEFGAAEIEAALRVLKSGTLFRYMPGAKEAAAFETSLAEVMETRYALATSSGTAALICGLSALGIGPGDEVLIPAYGFVACALAPLAVGAVPVICDIDESLTLDPLDAQQKVTARTKAVMPVHVNGRSADLVKVTELARRYGLSVIEDACQAIGGRFHGRRLGTIGDVGAYSFNQHKILTAGEGGALVTNSEDYYELAFIAHDGSCEFSPHVFGRPVHAGLAFRMSEITAAILLAQTARLDEILASLRRQQFVIHAALASAIPLRPTPDHDPAGNCGTHLAYQFETTGEADEFLEAVDDEHFRAFKGKGYGHSFSEWSLLHEGRGGHHPLRNALAQSPWRQQADDCARTAAILDRTVLISYGLNVPDRAVDELAERVAGLR